MRCPKCHRSQLTRNDELKRWKCWRCGYEEFFLVKDIEPKKHKKNLPDVVFKLLNTDKKVLESLELYKEGLNRKRLAEETGIPRSTIFDSLQRLILNGYVVKRKKYSGNKGSPIVIFSVVQK